MIDDSGWLVYPTLKVSHLTTAFIFLICAIVCVCSFVLFYVFVRLYMRLIAAKFFMVLRKKIWNRYMSA